MQRIRANYFIVPGLKNNDVILQTINISHSDILLAVSETFNVSIDAILIDNREQDITPARYCAFHLTKLYTGLKNGAIGKLFNRDRTTIVHGLRSFEDWMESVDGLPEKLKAVKYNLHNRQD